MKTIAVIAEFNPFHNGHAHLLSRAREESHADACLIIQSGNFVQRGAPALLEKRLRAAMALHCGADLVLELPVRYACANASVFARAAVTLLDRTGVVDELYFGSESGDIQPLLQLSELLSEETDFFSNALKKYIKTGLTYPAARAAAIHELTLAREDNLIFAALLKLPNNLLGIEYLSALSQCRSSIVPHTIKRKEAGHHSAKLPESFGFASAKAIREALLCQSSISDSIDRLRFSMPKQVLTLIEQEHPAFCQLEDFSDALYYQLLVCQGRYDSYGEIDHDLSLRISHLLSKYQGIDVFLSRLKTRNRTYASLSRNLMQLLLQIPGKAYPSSKCPMDTFPSKPSFYKPSTDYFAGFFQVLGATKQGCSLLGEISKKSNVPLIVNPGKEQKKLHDKAALSIFLENHFATQLYRGITARLYV